MYFYLLLSIILFILNFLLVFFKTSDFLHIKNLQGIIRNCLNIKN